MWSVLSRQAPLLASRRCATPARVGALRVASHAGMSPRRTLIPLARGGLSASEAQKEAEKVANSSTLRVMRMFNEFGDTDYIGEDFSIMVHSLQVARLAEQAGETEEVVLGCLLHDLGHLCGLEAFTKPGMGGKGTPDHENVGADFIGKLGFSDSVAYVTRQHVTAKRYLVATDPDYAKGMTSASKVSLQYQGGPMNEAERKEFESDSRFELALRCRRYDENGKELGREVKNLDDYVEMMKSNIRTTVAAQLAAPSAAAEPKPTATTGHHPVDEHADTYVLSAEQLQRWDEDGFLVIHNAMAPEELANIAAMCDEVAAFEDGANGVMVHHELSSIDNKPNLCRVENFCKNHPYWGGLAFGMVQDLVSQAYREKSVLFKDKVNFKAPGGGGFFTHQDATAYATGDLAQRHISVMIAVDAATPTNGPLQVATGWHTRGILKNTKGVTDPDVEAEMEFQPIMAKPGDIVLFDSMLPHRSDPNTSQTWRRLAYLTYNKASEGDFHEQYYRMKNAAFQQGDDVGTISINDDFGGRVVKL